MVPEISDDQVVTLVPALAEAARADRRTAARFVRPRAGILEETASRRHQFVFGRRGVGKSTLLRKIESAATDSDVEVIFVDIETLRGRPYPDVLIELLIQLLDALQNRLVSVPSRRVVVRLRRRATLRRIRTLRQALRALLDQPQSAERTIRELSARHTRAGVAGSVDVSIPRTGRVSAGAEHAASSEQETTSEATFVRSKMDGLLDAAVLIRSALAEAQEQLGDTACLIVLDDFYHVPYDDQADVLAYLHQIVKKLDIFLKVCGVRHRVQPFVEDDPPREMQIGQDAGEVSLDITLERFSAAQGFLEAVLRGICEPLGVAIEDVLTDGGRQRLVLGSGGVARDYLNLTQKALRNANERDANPSRPHNRITAEDVNEAAADLSGQKQEDLRRDAGPGADGVRERLTDVAKFCLDVNNTNVFLVEGPKLQEEDWGKEIQALADLRLVHQIGNLSVQTGSYRGRRFVGFTLDLSNWTGTRSERIRSIEFWTATGRQESRRARLVYTPGAADASAARPTGAELVDDADGELPGEWVQTSIYDELAQHDLEPPSGEQACPA